MEELKPGNLDSIVNNKEADKADQSEDSSKIDWKQQLEFYFHKFFKLVGVNNG